MNKQARSQENGGDHGRSKRWVQSQGRQQLREKTEEQLEEMKEEPKRQGMRTELQSGRSRLHTVGAGQTSATHQQ